MPARRDRHGVVVEDVTQVTRRGQADDPAAAPPDDGPYSGSSESPANVRQDATGDPHHYDEPTRLVRRSGRRSPTDDETTIVQRPGRSRQPKAESDDAGTRQDDSSHEDRNGRSHYDEPTQLVRRRKGGSPVDDETTTLRSRRTQEADRAPQDEADDPVTGWLVVVAGPGKGRSLTLGAGRNEVGRGASANVKLDFGDQEVSRNAHAYITYDDEARLWYIQQGGGRNLVRLAGRPVLEPMPLQARAEIRIGRTHLVFVPYCGEDFDWEDLGKQE